MPVEIERKFLVRDETWRDIFTSKQEITDGLIAAAVIGPTPGMV